MGKYCIQYLGYHRRRTLLVLLCVIMLTSLLLSIYPLFEIITFNAQNKLIDQCGEHHAVYFDITDKNYKDIKNHYSVEKVGIVKNSGLYVINDTNNQITVGGFDEEAFNLGHINIIEGKFPVNANEIALEEHYRGLFDNTIQIGDIISLSNENNRMEFVISGFIRDYTSYWTVDDEYTVGVNDFPGGIISYEQATEIGGYNNCLVYFNNIPENTLIGQPVLILLRDLSLELDLTFNDASYMEDYYIFSYSVQSYISIFTLIFLITSVCLLYYVYKLLISNIDSFCFNSLGASLKQILSVKIRVVLTPIILGTILGICIYFVSFLFILNLEHKKLIYEGLRNLSPLFLVHVICCTFLLFNQHRHSLLTKKEKQYRFFNKNYIFEFGIRNIGKNIKNITSVMLVICVLLSLISVIKFDYQYRPHYLNDSNYYLSSKSYSGYSYYIAGDFELRSDYYTYNIDQINQLKKDLEHNNVTIDYSYSSKEMLILPVISTSYWDLLPSVSDFYKAWNNGPSDGSIINSKNIESIPANTRATEFYRLLVIKDDEAVDFYSQYPDAKGCLENGSCVAFFPTMSSDWLDDYITYAGEENINELEEVSYYSQDYYSVGDYIRLGGVDYEGPYREAKYNYDRIKYHEEKIKIGFIYNEKYESIDYPVIIIGEQLANSMLPLCNISNISLTIPNTVSSSEYDLIKRAFNKVACTGTNSKITESLFFSDFYRDFYSMIEKALTIVAIFSIVTVIVILISLISMSLVNNKRTYGIMRSIGISISDFRRIIFVEYIGYWVIGLITTLPIHVYVVNKYVLSNLGMYLNNQDIITTVLFFCVTYIVGIVLILLIAIIFSRRIYKLNVSECIRIGE